MYNVIQKIEENANKLKYILNALQKKERVVKQQGGSSFFLVGDILRLNTDGINWCANDQKNCSRDDEKFSNFSNMLFRFIEYKDNNCMVKLIHPHELYEQWGGEDSDDLKFPEKYLIKTDP